MWGVNVCGVIDKPQLRNACSEGLAILNALHATICTLKSAINHYDNYDSYALALIDTSFASREARWCTINVGTGKISN